VIRDISAISIAREPQVWAPPPERMSFSKLLQIETCPRRWSLMSSDYPDIWEKRGYPDPLTRPALVGRVIHRAVEIITKELHRRGCTSVDDVKTISAMRDLGGFSRVIEISAEDVLFRYTDNPRASRNIEAARRILNYKKGDIREDVRIMLSRALGGWPTAPSDSSEGQRRNGALGPGVHPEVRLANEEMKWKGIVDLIRLSSDACEIRDIKSGTPKEEHTEQVQIYSLLWLLDSGKNPGGRPATKLTISYLDADVDVPLLPDSEVGTFKTELVARTRKAKEEAAGCPPKACPGVDNCSHCTVRHLCTAYWDKATTDVLAKDRKTWPSADVEARIIGAHGSRSYDAASIASACLPSGTPLIVRVSEDPVRYTEGDRVRFLDVCIRMDEGDEYDGQVIVVASTTSEAYLVKDS